MLLIKILTSISTIIKIKAYMKYTKYGLDIILDISKGTVSFLDFLNDTFSSVCELPVGLQDI